MERLYAEIWNGKWEYDTENLVTRPYPTVLSGIESDLEGDFVLRSFGSDTMRYLYVIAII